MRNFRPHYETPEDQAAEEAIAAQFGLRFGLISHKLNAVLYRVDFAMITQKNLLSAYAEVKDRGIEFGYRDGVYLSAAKVAHGMELARSAAVPFLFVVRFKGGEIAYANFMVKGFYLGPARWLGRTDRGTIGDMEPMHVIDWEFFNRL